MRLILGDSLPNTHHQLVTLAQQCFTALRTLHHVTLSKVAGHSGIIRNELADSLAGVKEYGSLGRFSGPRTAAFSPLILDIILINGSLSPTNSCLLDMISRFRPKNRGISPSTLEYHLFSGSY